MAEQVDDLFGQIFGKSGDRDRHLPLDTRVEMLCAEFLKREKRRPTHVHFTLSDELKLDRTSPDELDRDTAGRLLIEGARGTFTKYRGMRIVWDAPETRVSWEAPPSSDGQ